MEAKKKRAAPVKDNALYSKVLQVMGKQSKPMLVGDFCALPIFDKDKLHRSTRINEVVTCLGQTFKIQIGYNEQGKKVCATIDKHFPFSKTPPLRKDGTYKFSKQGVKKPVHPPLPPKVIAEKLAAAEQIAAVPPVEPAPAAPVAPPLSSFSLDALVHQFAETLGEALAKSFTQKFLATVAAQLPTQFGITPAASAPAGVPAAPTIRPKVIVAGLIPSQIELITQEFGNMLNISFIQSQEASNGKRIDQLVNSHEAAFAMTGFMSHSLYGKLRGAKQFVHVDGGMTTLRSHLKTYIDKHGQTQH